MELTYFKCMSMGDHLTNAKNAHVFFSLPLRPHIWPQTHPLCYTSFISRSRANSLRWWFQSFLRTKGHWQQLRPSKVSSCPLDLTTSLAVVSIQSVHCENTCLFVMVFTKKGRAWLSHTRGWISSQKMSLPQQHLSLKRKTSPNTPFLFTLSASPSLSPSHAQSIWLHSFRLVYFWCIKATKNRRPSSFFCCYHAPAVWQCVVYHDRVRERRKKKEKESGVLARGCRE